MSGYPAYECNRGWAWHCFSWYRSLCFSNQNANLIALEQLGLDSKSCEVCTKPSHQQLRCYSKASGPFLDSSRKLRARGLAAVTSFSKLPAITRRGKLQIEAEGRTRGRKLSVTRYWTPRCLSMCFRKTWVDRYQYRNNYQSRWRSTHSYGDSSSVYSPKHTAVCCFSLVERAMGRERFDSFINSCHDPRKKSASAKHSSITTGLVSSPPVKAEAH